MFSIIVGFFFHGFSKIGSPSFSVGKGEKIPNVTRPFATASVYH